MRRSLFIPLGLAALVLVGSAPAVAQPAHPTRRLARPGARGIQTGPPIFEPYQAYAVGSFPESAAILDVTGDGRNDVLLTTSYYFDPDNDFKLFVFVQRSDGTLRNPIRLDTDIQYGGLAELATGDLTGDGKDDVAISTASGVDVFPNKGTKLGARRLIPTSDEVFSLVIADMNADGQNDIVVAGRLGLQILTNTGHGGFTATSVTTDPQWEVEVGDLNGDGRPDIAGCSGLNECTPTLNVFYQQPDGTFQLQAYPAVTGYWSGGDGVGVGDVTGDGRADAFLTIPGNQPGALIDVWHQLPDGTLSDPVIYNSYDIPEPVAAADVNGDGRNDVVTLHGGWDEAGVYYQRPNGDLFTESLYPISYASHYNMKGFAVGDINGDGLADLALADYNNGLVVLRQKAP